MFIGKSISNTTSLYLSWLLGLSNLLIAFVANYTQKQNKETEERPKHTFSPQVINRLKGACFAVLLLVLFGVLYKNANPVFDNLIVQINFNFVSIPWLVFTFLGYILFLNILKPLDARELVAFDLAQKNHLEKPTEEVIITEKQKLESEHTLGTIIFTALNLLLLFFLATDIIYIVQKTEMTNAAYSESVHQGVYALLFSVVIAIVLILYFFRGNLNFYKKNQHIKSLTYVWICLNLLLLIFTGYKNFTYVEVLGLTYKRIGVFVYLMLNLTGLITAYIKVARVKSFVYLVRTNLATVFAFLILSAAIPWDNTITWFNISTLHNPDINYLISLGNTNSRQLYEYADLNEMDENLRNRIQEKYTDYLTVQATKTWQEYTLTQLVSTDTK
ncbi:hypothetical protein A9200_08135 [Maribacter hydrothermalis]|uniref:Uncharacterized protein n=1 Tax=Maribacter hydrothermalis TaxID=1836467 RepID=A0A1B7Z0Z9_9FLAO|nr:hypothetical protein BTR34_12245 [Maribacter hydrothermalis]OBR36393.1 hypothetical protein A9200_08135 [Maribacter hydrothermalis]